MLASSISCPPVVVRSSRRGSIAAYLGLLFPLLLVVAMLAACGDHAQRLGSPADGGQTSGSGQSSGAGQPSEGGQASDAGQSSGSGQSSGGGQAGGGGGDAGPGGGSDAGAAGGLTIAAPAGITLLQRPTREEGLGVTGLIVVTAKDQNGDEVPASGATVEVNGVAVPAVGGIYAAAGVYDVSKVATAVPAAAGQALTVKATSGGRTGSLTMQCPAEVTITSPEENANVEPGGSFTFAWSGQTTYESGLLSPVAGLHSYSITTDHLTAEATRAIAVTPGLTSTVFPIGEEAFKGYVAQVAVPGTLVDTEAGVGLCVLVRRVHVYTVDPR